MRKLFFLLLLWGGPAVAATATLGVTINSTSNGSSYTSGSFTPANGDLLVAYALGRATVTRPATMTDSLSGTWTQILAIDGSVTTDTQYLFVRTASVSNSSMTVTFDCTGDAATGLELFVVRIAGMSRFGSSAVLQTANQTAQSAGGTPAPSFGSSALNGNVTLAFITSQAGTIPWITEPSGWTERADVGFTSPTTSAEYATRDSGFTGTTITWGSSSSQVFGDVIVELDTSSSAAARRRVVN